MIEKSVEALAAERIAKDHEACEAAWNDLTAHLISQLADDPKLLELMKNIFLLGWESGVLYMGKHPL